MATKSNLAVIVPADVDIGSAASCRSKLLRRVKTVSAKKACTLDFDGEAPGILSIQLAAAARVTLEDAGVSVTLGDTASAVLAPAPEDGVQA